MSAVESPLISVVIPAFDSEAWLAETIDSVLAQTYSPVETIVVDDGSSDGTAEVAAGYPEVQLLRGPNRGPSAARNRGFAASTGELIAFHDADDIMPADKLELQAGLLIADAEIGLVVGEQELLIEEGAELPFWDERSSVPTITPARPPEFADEPLIHPMTMVMRRRVFEQVGGFEESMRYAEDLDWLLRARELGIEVHRLDQVVLRRRVHRDSLTQDSIASRAGLLRAFKLRIDRHRARAADQGSA
jgi:glycosyltransferase involved in cell wall biosynthesis